MKKGIFKNILLTMLVLGFIIIGSIFILIRKTGVVMTFKPNVDMELENFDDIWGLGDPAMIEKKFHELLPQAKSLKDKSLYLQILSQIALAQALQKKFDTAHKTLNTAQELLTPEYDLARVRILLERGRVFQQAEKIDEARSFFEQSFELSSKHKFYDHAINAAHMIAIIAEKIEDKIKWNKIALDLAASSNDKRARKWLGPLYNNLGQNYLQARQFENALLIFQKALKYRKKEGYIPNIRIAKWAVACALRSLGRLDDALSIQKGILKEYDAITKSGIFDIPPEMFTLTRGYIYEEIAEIYSAKAAIFANLAYADLSDNIMFKNTAPERLERLKNIIKNKP